MPQWRARTWLQLMCCALTLELGVLILEGSERCDGSECGGVGCDRPEV